MIANKNRVPFFLVRFFQMLFWCGCFCEVLFCRCDFVHMFVSSHGRTNNAFFDMQFWCFVSLAWLLYEILSILIFFFFFIFSLNLIHRSTKTWHLAVCPCHVTDAFKSKSTLYCCLNVKELLAQSRCKIWSLSHCNWTRTQNH